MINTLLIFASGDANRTISYQHGWPKYFMQSSYFHCTPLNLMGISKIGVLFDWLKTKTRRFDAVVMLHSTFSNVCYLQGRLFEAVKHIQAPKAYFIGNEYKLIPEKMTFCEQLGVNLFITQKSDPAAQAIYQNRLGCRTIDIPGAGLDSEIFFPQTDYADRPIDIGFRAADEPLYFGHQERRDISNYFLKQAPQYGLNTDISMANQDRFSQLEYAAFLNRCKAQLATEAGKDYMELDDRIRTQVNDHQKIHPEATLSDIRQLIFSGHPPSASGRSLSGRNIEAAGTKTLQIMFEGQYSGYFQPDCHYLALKKDFSNFGEVIEKFRDEKHCRQIIDNAYQTVFQKLTYPKLIDRLHKYMLPLL